MQGKDDIRAKVVAEIIKLSKQKKATDVPDSAHLELDLGIDSLNRVELASNLLDLFHVEDAPVEEAAQLATVGEVLTFVHNMLQQKG
jgi:acyl carrier protein